jgi:hypothetical protein
MGYDLHITRKEHWFEESEPGISLEEWHALAQKDIELRIDGYAEATSPKGEVIRFESPGICVWLGHSMHRSKGTMVYFSFGSGGISVKNPDEETRRKMWRIAQTLSANVQGDEGERYGADGREIGRASRRRPWWQFW